MANQRYPLKLPSTLIIILSRKRQSAKGKPQNISHCRWVWLAHFCGQQHCLTRYQSFPQSTPLSCQEGIQDFQMGRQPQKPVRQSIILTRVINCMKLKRTLDQRACVSSDPLPPICQCMYLCYMCYISSETCLFIFILLAKNFHFSFSDIKGSFNLHCGF